MRTTLQHSFVSYLTIFLCLFFAFGSLSNAAAKPQVDAEEDPKVLLAETINKILDVLHEEQYRSMTVDEKNNYLLSMVEERFSLDLLIQRSLGRNWQKLSAAQRNEFKRLFSKLIVYTYCSRLEEAGNNIRPEFTFGRTIDLSRDRLELESTVQYNNNQLAVYYRLVKQDQRWEVYDIIVEGVSLLKNYRSQFDSILSRESVDALLDTLREKIAAF